MSSSRSFPRPLERAYAACVAMARAHYENFPVASWLLPASMRPHVAAVYAFARIADDIADEGSDSAAARQSRLEAWQRSLHDAVAGGRVDPAGASRDELILAALRDWIPSPDLPLLLFD